MQQCTSLVVNYKSIITCRYVENRSTPLEQGFVRMSRGCPKKGSIDFLDPSEWHRSRDSTKLLVDLREEGSRARWRGQKSTIFVSRKKSRRCAPGRGDIDQELVCPMHQDQSLQLNPQHVSLTIWLRTHHTPL